MRWKVAAALAIAAAAQQAGGAEQSADTSWYSISAADGARLGHASREVRTEKGGRHIVETREIVLKEGDRTTRVSERTSIAEDSPGVPATIREETRIGRSWTRTDLRIVGRRAEVTRRTPQETRQSAIPLPEGVRFDLGEGLLRGWDPDRTPRLEFDNLNLSAMAVERVVIEKAARRPGDPPGTLPVMRTRYERGELRSIARLLLDSRRQVVEAAQPMFGTSILTRRTDRETALKPHPPYSPLGDSTMKSPFRLSGTALRGRIRYLFSYREGLRFTLPQTAEQRTRAAGEAIEVDVCAGCEPAAASGAQAPADALEATPWLQSDHPRLQALARPIARLEIGPARKMELLAAKARPYLGTIDFTGHYSALETLSRRRGDCTEAAVLLAALGRAAGIPTRVANGLVYSRERYHGVGNVFIPHSWTLAWIDGQWRSYDLALDAFDSSHIALTVGDGDPRSILAAGQLASLLTWESMAEVRKRPAT